MILSLHPHWSVAGSGTNSPSLLLPLHGGQTYGSLIRDTGVFRISFDIKVGAPPAPLPLHLSMKHQELLNQFASSGEEAEIQSGQVSSPSHKADD